MQASLSIPHKRPVQVKLKTINDINIKVKCIKIINKIS